MKKSFLSSVAITFLLGGSALAADLPVKAKPIVCPGCDWSGFYAGLNVGGGIGHNNSNDAISIFPFAPPGVINPLASSSTILSPAGAMAGGQIGYNWQSSNWVLGVEADWDWSGQRGTTSVQNFIASSVVVAPAQLAYSDEQKIKWLATLRGRLGWAQNCFLWYLTGGVAFGEVESNYNFQISESVGATFGPVAAAASSSTTKTGWTVGTGVETSLAWFGASNRWSAKLEYLYVDLGSVSNSFTVPNTGVPGSSYTISSSSDIHDHIIRAGLNYRFGG